MKAFDTAEDWFQSHGWYQSNPDGDGFWGNGLTVLGYRSKLETDYCITVTPKPVTVWVLRATS